MKKSTRKIPARGGIPVRYGDNEITRGAYCATGYHAVRVSTREGRSGTAASGDVHAKYDRAKLINLSREFFRDNAIYHGMISKAAEYIVGGGFGLQAKTSDPAWNSAAETIWREWWKRPEIRGVMSGTAVEEMVAREVLLCGDTGAIKTKDRGLLQLVEAEQLVGNEPNADGIEKDAYGRPLTFLVAPYRDRTGAPIPSDAKRISAADFLFLTRPERPSSLRGVPPAQSAFSMIHRINDVCDAEAFAWQLLSRLAISITREGAAAIAFGDSETDDTKTVDADLASRIHQFDTGLVFHGEPGEKVEGIDRNIPGKDFTASLTTFLRLLGLPLGLPLEFILLDWTKSNYSQSRAILEQAQQSFGKWQTLLEMFFHRPAYEWRIARAIQDGELPKNAEWNAHEWIMPRFPWIDQLKEAQAQGVKIERAFCTHGQVLKGEGLDREEVIAARELEIRDAIGRVQAIESETGVRVPWEYLAGLSPSVNAAKIEQPGDEKKGRDEEAPEEGEDKEKPEDEGDGTDKETTPDE